MSKKLLRARKGKVVCIQDKLVIYFACNNFLPKFCGRARKKRAVPLIAANFATFVRMCEVPACRPFGISCIRIMIYGYQVVITHAD